MHPWCVMKSTLLLLGAVLLTPACTFVARKPAELPPRDAAALAEVEEYYLARAREQAAFTAHCPPEQVLARVVSSKPGEVPVTPRDSWRTIWVEWRRITIVGTDGCGERQSFSVVCGPHSEYADVSEFRLGRACDVLPAEQGLAATKRSHEQQIEEERARAETEATAAAAAAAQQKK